MIGRLGLAAVVLAAGFAAQPIRTGAPGLVPVRAITVPRGSASPAPTKTTTRTAAPRPATPRRHHQSSRPPTAQRKAVVVQPVLPALTFRIASFNALGASHTAAGGDEASRPSGATRALRASRLVQRGNFDVVGFQELQSVQRSTFLRAVHRTYQLYPGDQLRSEDGENSIAWRADEWQLLKAASVPIAYFGGHPRNMPIVLLRDRATGLSAWFANFHNPADTNRFGKQGKWRVIDKAQEIKIFQALQDTRLPVFVTGDMNERASYFCSVSQSARLVSASGGDVIGGCHPPAGGSIDWIFGSPGVVFSSYLSDRSPFVQSTTDHPVVSSDATIDGALFPQAVLPPVNAGASPTPSP
ncbi:MAG: endonuclease/exonuclease/phosphatase family protein [Actinomycetota bacterium]|nr:endonuclease/exonuclease/phosphatase family protein [Actinomycetota bacterium]